MTAFNRKLPPLNRGRMLVVVAMLTLSLSSLSHASEVCPWMNAATASGFLQGAVTATVTHPSPMKEDATCEFARHDGKLASDLRIEVQTMKDPALDFAAYNLKCGPDAAPLRAIGNEALVCSLKGKKKQVSEQVVSRVRDRAFVVRVSSNATPPDPAALRETARRISEQVAGSLF